MTDRKINIVGILDVVTAAAHFDTQKGPVIEIFSMNMRKSIHAAGQWKGFSARWMTDP